MAHVVVTIAGRTYRMSCEDGEEPRLEQLARYVEGKIHDMREGFGEIGEQRVVVMAAIALADEASDARGRTASLESNLAGLRAELDSARRENAALKDRLAGALEEAARRLERLNADLRKRAAGRDDAL